jgi:hypothetical protein
MTAISYAVRWSTCLAITRRKGKEARNVTARGYSADKLPKITASLAAACNSGAMGPGYL